MTHTDLQRSNSNVKNNRWNWHDVSDLYFDDIFIKLIESNPKIKIYDYVRFV